MSKFIGYDKYCTIDLDSKKADCGDKNHNVQTTCARVKDNVKTYYDNSATPSASLTNQTMAIARDPSIDYNYFRASRNK
jgi:hypothetical protein